MRVADAEMPASAVDYAVLQVTVQAHGQQAELEVQTDAWDSYEGLRELVVDAIPQLFRETDELLLEYMDGRGAWKMVKLRTPVATVKAARCARIVVPDAAPITPGHKAKANVKSCRRT